MKKDKRRKVTREKLLTLQSALEGGLPLSVAMKAIGIESKETIKRYVDLDSLRFTKEGKKIFGRCVRIKSFLESD